MTLFDRKVDLAKFTPSTPLYVMCRDWMCNNPKRVGRHHQNGVTVATGLVDGGKESELPEVGVANWKYMCNIRYPNLELALLLLDPKHQSADCNVSDPRSGDLGICRAS